jgi:hypothetical protein
MSLSTQAQSFDSEQELLSSEGVKGGTEITENLDTDTDGKGDGTKGFPELETVVTGRWVDELWEASGVLAPVKLARVDNDTTDGCTMSTNPFLYYVRRFFTASSSWIFLPWQSEQRYQPRT